MKTEEADDKVARRHAAYSGERVLDVGRSEQTENERHGVLGATEPELDHIREPAVYRPHGHVYIEWQ